MTLLLKGYKRVFTCGGFQAPDSERARAQCTIVGYLGVFPYCVLQEYSTKRDYVFSLLFFHDPVLLVD